MRHATEPLLEAIRCELLGVQSRLEARERGAEPAGTGRAAAGDKATAVPMFAGAADTAGTGGGAAHRDREVAVPLVIGAAPGRRLRR
jgi:hypothetical protein